MTDAGDAPIIVTALFGAADFAWLDGLRRAHFPPERNLVPAHLTLFHHLPPAIAPELQDRLAALARMSVPPAVIRRPISLGRGVALLVDSPALAAMRDELADAFSGLLDPAGPGGMAAACDDPKQGRSRRRPRAPRRSLDADRGPPRHDRGAGELALSRRAMGTAIAARFPGRQQS